MTSPLADQPAEELRKVVDVNLVGYLLCAKHAIRSMSGGAIVNISSSAATIGGPGEYVHYAATKAATDALTVGLAAELAAAHIPLGRSGEPEEVAGAVAWLLSDGASYTTGAVLRVAGGL